MFRRVAGGLFAVLVGCAALGTAGVGAATQIGSDCEATSVLLDEMATQSNLDAPTSILETATPGVVTSWRVTTSIVPSGPLILKVLKRVGNEYEVLAESAPGTLVKGKNVFPTRIPVAAGTSFGTSASSMIPACKGAPGDEVARFSTAPGVGDKAEPSITDPSTLLALMVVVEPDADGDGFGDETQDKCPQSAATQGACPPPPDDGGGGTGGATVKLKGKPKLEGNVVAVKLTTSVATKLTATGSIRGKRAAKPVTKTVSPGETGRLYLSLKKSVKRRLANLPRKRKLRMVVEVKAAGTPTLSAEISLPGRKKPQPAHTRR